MGEYFFKNIKIEGSPHLFVCKGHSRIAETGKLEEPVLFKRQLYANLYKVDDHILKVCYGQSIPKDIMRKYGLKSQAEREAGSAATLSRLGLMVPRTYFSAFSLFPLTRRWVESIHEMDFLAGYQDIRRATFIHCQHRFDLITCFGKDLATILDAMLCPKDLGFGNVMYHPDEGKLAWIDTDLKKFKSKEALARNLATKLNGRIFNYLDGFQINVFWKAFFSKSILFTDEDEVLRSYISPS